jgi:hypothetical protein
MSRNKKAPATKPALKKEPQAGVYAAAFSGSSFASQTNGLLVNGDGSVDVYFLLQDHTN